MPVAFIISRPISRVIGKPSTSRQPPPEHPRSGIMIQVEGNRWLVSLNGVGEDAPPTDETGFLNYMRKLRHPALYDILKHAEPAGPVVGFRHTGNRRRHVEQMKRWPERFIVMGDALAAFNPAYGQGMTVAALESLALDKVLKAQRQRQPAGDLTGMAQRFHKEISKIVTGAFTLASSEDYRYAGTEGGEPGRMTRFMHWYLDQITQLKVQDRAVNEAFIQVLHMLQGPEALFQPPILAKVLKQGLGRGRARQQSSTLQPTPNFG